MTTLAIRAQSVRKLAVAFTVYGKPVPQGSKVAFASRNPGASRGMAMLKDSNEKELKPWRGAVHNAGLRAMVVTRRVRPPFDGPLAVRMVFTFEKPKSVSRTTPCVAPDGDKLARACADSLTTSQVWVDDSRAVEWTIRKVYVEHDPEALPRPGVRIAIWTIIDQPDLDGVL